MKYNLSTNLYRFFLLAWVLNALPCTAQIIPDQTLPVNSRVTPQGNTTSIEGGTAVGNNLFHSFSEFSVPTDQTAAFSNNLSVQNIITRVTGQTPSSIDGILKANGKANLFLLNSNGIIFGPNAKLEIGGSFLASTANSIRFKDGGEFPSAGNDSKPLLSISVPIGLYFGSQTGDIVVQGQGHRLRGPGGGPVTAFDVFGPGLEVQPGKTLGLVGGGITLDGAVLSAKSGNLLIGSLNKGYVAINPSISGYNLNYSELSTFSNINLTNRTLLNASGLGNGNIHVQGKNITIDRGAVSIIQNFGSYPSGDIRFTATRQLTISGTDPVARIVSGIYSESLGTGNGADIKIFTPKLILSEAGTITSKTFGIAKAGDITLDIPEFTQISGVSPLTPSALSAITSLTGISSGRTGDINLSTKNLFVTDGAILGTLSASSGKGGDVVINASDGIFVSGVEASLLTPALITASAFRKGDAGSVIINTSKLIVRDGGRVDSSTTFSGSAGKVTINASELVEVTGTVPGSKNPSLITSSANVLDDSLLDKFSILKPIGTSGDVIIQTKNLLVKDGGRISVQNDGPNDAGQLNIRADRITLENSGTITAKTNGGDGGNISLLTYLLLLKDGSMTASALKQGKGGNININSDLVVALGKSSITANAEDAQGGNIYINAKGVFFSADTVISASSKLGPQFTGTVEINAERTGAEETTAPAPDVTSVPKVTSVCNPSSGPSKFVVMGPGALQTEPRDLVSTDSVVGDPASEVTSTTQTIQKKRDKPIIQEANGFQQINGKIYLIAEPKDSPSVASEPVTCDKT